MAAFTAVLLLALLGCSTAHPRSLLQTTTPTSPPPVASSPALNCTPGFVASNLSGNPLCVSPVQASFRLANRNLSDWTSTLQTSFVNDLATQIGLSPNQINVTRVAQGSVLVNTDFFPLNGTALDSQTVSLLQSKLQNNTQLPFDNNTYGNVFVTGFVPPAGGNGSNATNATVVPLLFAPPRRHHHGLSGGAIAGIVIAGVVALILLLILIYLCLRCCRFRTRERRPRVPQGDHLDKPVVVQPPVAVPIYNQAESSALKVTGPALPASTSTAPIPVRPEPIRPLQENFTPRAAAVTAPSSSTKSVTPPVTPLVITTPPVLPVTQPSPAPGKAIPSSNLAPAPLAAAAIPVAVSSIPKRTPTLFSRSMKEEKIVAPPPEVVTAPPPPQIDFEQFKDQLAGIRLSLEDVQSATNNFGRENLIGEGGLGRVYRGDVWGTEYAIKNLDPKLGADEWQFLNWVLIMSQLHHPHVAELVYFCWDDTHRILAHEFVPNRTLADHLHGDKDTGRKPGSPLTWNTRMEIALEMAAGLEFLHSTSPVVVHGCFKTHNVLLDNDLEPKITDAGFASLFPLGDNKQLTSKMLGTNAYTAPEFSMSGEHTIKGDVYSFGVVLLELMTGRKPLDSSRAGHEQSLVRWATPMLNSPERLREMVDPELEGVYPVESLLRFAGIVRECVQPDAESRPLMGEVVEALQALTKF